MLRFARPLLILGLLLGALALPPPARTQDVTVTPQTPASTDQIIVRYREDSLSVMSVEAQADALSIAAGAPLSYGRPASGDLHIFELAAPLPLDDAAALAARIAADPAVAYAEPDLPVTIARTPNDARFSDQWHYGPAAIWGANLESAWALTTGAPGLTIAVIDTGVRPDHPDLAGRSVPSLGYDMVSGLTQGNDGDGRDADPSDPGDSCNGAASTWHGTHVAGTIGAASDNAIGVVGVNWQSRLLHVRAIGRCDGRSSDLIDAIRWAAGLPVVGAPLNPNPARVINMSLGITVAQPCGTALQQAITDAVNQGVVLVAAAGNSGGPVLSPANCAGVIAVAATGARGQRASYSSVGPEADLAAPGGADGRGVLSTINLGTSGPGEDGYGFKQGTSMATPHVAGVASLILSVNPSLTPAEVEALLRANTTSFPSDSGCTTGTCGTGILNAGLAVAAAGAPPALTGVAPPSGVLATPYSHTFSATGRPAPSFSISAGALPPGLTLNAASGQLSGLPALVGTYSFTVRAANGVGSDATQSVTLRVNQSLGFTSQPPGAAIVGQPYQHTFTASGSPAPAFRVASGQLPTGLTLSPSGVLSGTPQGPGVIADLVIEATRGAETATQPVRLTAGQVPAITSAPPPAGQVGTPYRYQITGSGFPAPAFTVSGGAPPPGLSLSASTGDLSGTPTAAGVFSFTIRAANGIGTGATQRVSVTVRSAFGDVPQAYLPMVTE